MSRVRDVARPERAGLAALVVLLVSLASASFAEVQRLDTEDAMIPSADPGIQLYVRNKHPAGMTNFPAQSSGLNDAAASRVTFRALSAAE